MAHEEIISMTRDDLDVLWNRALQESVKAGEHFTRYHFAALVAAAEREECAKVCDELAELNRQNPTDALWQWEECAAAIRNRSNT